MANEYITEIPLFLFSLKDLLPQRWKEFQYQLEANQSSQPSK